MILRTHTNPIAAVLAAGAILAGCGGSGDERLDEPTAQRLIRELDQVDSRVAAGECDSVRRGSLVRLERTVESLPSESSDIRSALEDGFTRLRDLIDAQCEDDTETQTETTPTQTQTTPPPTETEPPTQTETQQTQTAPPDEDGDEDDGGGGGQTAPEQPTPPGQDGFPPGQGGRGGEQGIAE